MCSLLPFVKYRGYTKKGKSSNVSNIWKLLALIKNICTFIEQSLADGAPPVLVGRMSREMKGLIENASENSKHLMAVKLFSDFFTVSVSLCLF